jgi:O-methyltransferase involved in polyketide biosynthesis
MPTEDLKKAKEILDASLDRPSVGRIYDYYLGGRHNYAIDREFAQHIIRDLPEARIFARQNRGFVRRAVRYARRDQGIRQFVDIGSGLPTQGNVHEIADEDGGRDALVLYVDNDPVARAHSRVLLADTADPQRHFALDGDFQDGPVLWQRVVEQGIDPDAPICLLVTALLHFQLPEQRPDEMLAFYRDQLAPGSLLVLSHATDEDTPPATRLAAARYVATTSRAHLRPRAEIRAFFGDLELVEPGLVWTPQWRPELAADGEPPFTDEDPTRALAVAGVGRKA